MLTVFVVGVEGEKFADRAIQCEALLGCSYALLHLGSFVGGISGSVTFGVGAESAMPRDMTERAGKFGAGEGALEGVGTERPWVGMLLSPFLCQRILAALDEQPGAVEQMAQFRHSLTTTADHAALATVESPNGGRGSSLLGCFWRVEHADARTYEWRVFVEIQDRPADRSDPAVNAENENGRIPPRYFAVDSKR